MLFATAWYNESSAVRHFNLQKVDCLRAMPVRTDKGCDSKENTAGGKNGMVKTKSVYDPVEPDDGERILVTRYWPRGLSKERLSLAARMREVAPSVELLRDWKAGKISWAEYETRYFKEMASQTEKIRDLAQQSRHNTITLLCFERENNPHCHRYLLKKLIERVIQAV